MEPGEEQVQNSTRGLTPQPVLITNNQRELFREKMTHPQNELILSQMSKPWAIVKRIVGLVIITYLLSQSILMIFFGLYLGEFEGIFMSYIGLFCSLPLLFIFFWIRRPRLIHIKLAIPNEEGKKTHILPNNETLVTPIPTKFSHHLVHDSGLLDMPPSKKLWMIFASTMLISLLIFIALLNNPSDFIVIITIIFVIPTWLAGFSIPVFAWWSYSARTLNMPTTGYRAESALVAGMICTIPALLINTSGDIFFLGIFGLDSPISQLLLLSLIAPIGEEICKLAAIWWCKEFIDSPRRGFEIGITVGLGFAMLENLQYIALSWTGGPLSFTITSLIRAIGSIPGHALWTGLTGIGFAWYILKNDTDRENIRH
ncbi:MAG: PrsW family glutamic-type intramembrane protease, partial [Candidatus Thermoplasmatota archaeon]|nr:PrsW family glutamic-type intramembrane protease [Candidatus Thermoplasmatota archaeon]